jgi:hypothetical protein
MFVATVAFVAVFGSIPLAQQAVQPPATQDRLLEMQAIAAALASSVTTVTRRGATLRGLSPLRARRARMSRSR